MLRGIALTKAAASHPAFLRPHFPLGLALLSGLISAAAFPPFDFRFGVLLGPWLLFMAVRRAGPRFLTGFLHGIGLLAPLVWWLATFHPLAPWGTVVLAACFPGLATRVVRGPFAFAAALTGAEFARSSGALAFPWGVAGSALYWSSVAALAPWLGLFGLSFLVYLLAGLAWTRPAVAVALAGGIVLVAAIPERPRASSSSLTIGVVQGAFLPEEDYEFRSEEILDELLTRTRALARRGAELVVWSETVILEYLNRPGRARGSIQRLADEEKVALVVGAPAYLAPDEKRNSAFLFLPGTGEREPRRYDKVHLVPFGEYFPGYGPTPDHVFLPQGVGDFSPAPLLLPIGKLGLLVCYEGAFPTLAAALAGLDVRLFINISNDAWARSAAEARQHSDLTRLRAFETRRPFVRAGNVGESFIQAADGRLLAWLAEYERGEIIATVAVPDAPPRPAGEWIGIMALLGFPFLLTIFLPQPD